MADQDYYRRMINEDFQNAPLSEADQGYNAGARIVNDNVDATNRLLQAADKLKRSSGPMDPESMKAAEDVQSLYRDKEFDQNRFNVVDPNSDQALPQDPARDPSSVASDILLGKDVTALKPQAPMMTPSQPVDAAPVNKLTDAITRSTPSNIAIPKPGSTAPQVITEQEVADKARQTGQAIDDQLNPDARLAMFNILKSGKEAKSNAEQVGAQTEVMGYQNQLANIQQKLDENARLESLARTKAEDQLKAMGPINPDRVWADRSIWSKLALVAGAAVLGRAGSSAGLTAMQDLVTKDLEAQKADMEAGVKREGSLLEMLKPYASNRQELYKMGNQLSMDMTKSYAKAIAAGVSKQGATADAIKELDASTQKLLTERNKNDKNIQDASKIEQDRQMNDQKLMQKFTDQRLEQAKQKIDLSKIEPEEGKRLTGLTAMAISAKRMKELENEKDFDPTKMKEAIVAKLQGKGVPGVLNENEAEYLANYAAYFSYLKQSIFGTRPNPEADAKIKLMMVPDQTFTKQSIKFYQRKRNETINGAINSLSPAAQDRIKNIPEYAEFNINRAQPLKSGRRPQSDDQNDQLEGN